MSHIAITSLKLINPNRQLLKKAVAQLAKELKGELVSEIVDYSGKRVAVSLGLKTSQIFRGVGIEVDEAGNVKFKGDYWKYQKDIDLLKKQLVQSYTSLAVQTSLTNMGYKVKQQKKEKKIYVFAEA